MIKKRFISMLALLMTAATGARADWTGGTYTATATENLGAITVNGDATLTINSDVTVTVNGGITIAAGKTLTVKGPGTLEVKGTNGKNGKNDSGDSFGNSGGDGGAAVIGTIVVQDGANVMATGGKGGNSGVGERWSPNGSNGGAAFSGAVTIYDGTISASGGNGGDGDCGIGDGSDGGTGGDAFTGTLTYYGGSVTATGGNGGGGIDGDANPGKAFVNDVDFTQTTGYSVTNGTSTIGSVLNQTKVVISGGTPIPAGYSVALKSGTEDATNWQGKAGEGKYQALPLEGVAAGTAVSFKYFGTKKVESVKAVKKAAVPVTAITLNKTETSIMVGATETLSVTSVLPEEATDKTYTWKTSDETKATVDQDGKVTAVAAGTVNIYAEANDGSGVKGNCAVTVQLPTLSLTSPAVGQVIGSDGKNYAAADVPSGVTKVAMIAYVSGSNGLAIALADEVSSNLATAKSTCEAKTPAFTGGTWKLPTENEWKQMFSANGGSDESCTGLNNALAAAGGNSSKLQDDGYDYWTSTVDYGNDVYVMLESDYVSWNRAQVGSDRVNLVRACLAF